MSILLDDSIPLQRLTIPGTHNSGARYGGAYTGCQDTSIEAQLNSGIRFLDIRCRAFEGKLYIHHGATYQNLTFQDVLDSCRNFLSGNPRETVLMRVKQEYSEERGETFGKVFDQYLDAGSNPPAFHLGGTLPLLGQARGKVILLADNAGLPGVRYGDASVFDIQDAFMTEPIAKFKKIEDHFLKAVSQPGKLFVNYVSTAAALPIGYTSRQLNPKVKAYSDGLRLNGKVGLGIIPMDYPNNQPGLLDSLLLQNFARLG
ncbi:phosphatidylinositol-specific phospholipase C [Streptomyces sp. NPDC056519]|uniref:phosphatidylinositol-specific phospholipase C n=1 Tax=Streptomyces sp. NPDC056519 TaxID=3345849 RepID=UPI0036AD59AA